MLRGLYAAGSSALVVLGLAISCGASGPPVSAAVAGGRRAGVEPPPATPASSAAPSPPEPLKELPRGGRALFPEYRLVGYCGTPGAPALGSLLGNLQARARALETEASHYADGRKPLPVFELIAVVVQSGAGPDGKFRRRVDDSVVDQYLRAARQAKALLLLNVQPGHSDFLTEVKSFESYLHEPDVGLALDPEWAMKPKQQPGVYYGQTTGEVVNDVGAYLSEIVEKDNLPEKALVFHQVNREVLKDEELIGAHPGVVLIKSVDGLGPAHTKVNTYNYLIKTMQSYVHPGFKLFFDEDTRNGSHLMAPRQVMSLNPKPEYVMYE
ncbi:MAG TPA: hypothetical protein VKU41_12700 [Polyangiaceae bacterium]|nr:hypothetical protein [Polyangiaceae bacterium]